MSSMTSLTAHRARPFSYFSSHIDASVIQWSLLRIPNIGIAQIKFLLNCNHEDIFCGKDENEIKTNHINARISGK